MSTPPICMWLIRKFKEWRRGPYKRAVIRMYSDGHNGKHILNSETLHAVLAEIDKV